MQPDPRSIYTYDVHGNVIAITDRGGPEDLRVHFDADNVIADLVKAFGSLQDRRLICTDDGHHWTELAVTPIHTCGGLRGISARGLDAALREVAATPRTP